MKICPTCQRSYPTAFAICPQDGARLTEPLEWSEGTIIRGKYRIVGKIGEGGMGAVYKATHMHFNEACALKVMAPSLMNDTGLVKRFGREAIIARKLRHRNAVKVEDFDETEDGRPFIVMEFIEGQSLKTLMNAHGPLPVSRTCSIIKQAAAALEAAHELGLVHRDIKPDNIVLVFSHGEEVAKVLDFGIAKIRGAQSSAPGMALTATGMVIGTPPYMSPEQAKGSDSDELDGRSDIYSLGVLMYQMLTGALPLKADTPLNMLFAQIQTPPTPIYEAGRGLSIPAAVGSLVMKCLEKDPAHRPQTGRDLIVALELCEREVQAIPGNSPHSKAMKDFSESTTVSDTPARATGGITPVNSVASADEATVRTPGGKQTRREPPQTALFPDPTLVAAGAAHQSPEPASGAGTAVPGNSASSSRSAIMVLAVIVVLAAGGGWYFMHRSSGAAQSSPPTPANENLPAVDQPPATQSSSDEVSPAKTESHEAKPLPARKTASERVADALKTKRAMPEAASAVPPETNAEKAARAKTVSATSSLGDLYLQNGEFDNAIMEYTKGLEVDPSNKSLQDKIAQAIKAKVAAQISKH
ncbi:MAG: protein kinase [Candidatus Acidiferrum sp.]